MVTLALQLDSDLTFFRILMTSWATLLHVSFEAVIEADIDIQLFVTKCMMNRPFSVIILNNGEGAVSESLVLLIIFYAPNLFLNQLVLH